MTGTLTEKRLVDRDDLRNVRDRVLGQTGCSDSEKNVSWRVCQTEIARERNDDYGCDSTSVECVPLNDQNRSSEPRS